MLRLYFNLIVLAVLIVLCHVCSGCRKPSAVAENVKRAGNANLGSFRLKYEPRKNPAKNTAGHRVGENEQALAGIVADLNKKIALPFDIYLSVSDCDQPDAYYDPETHTVIVCHQLVDEYYDLFNRRLKDKSKLDETVRGATAATFFHELGHALVDAWKLPITGKEEDAADQLSTIVLINRTDTGEQMALSGALSFALYAHSSKGEEKIYWDEHSLDEQRFYDTICMIYGHNPQKYQYLIKEGTLPQDRAVNCQADYQRIEKSWRTLMAPHLK